MAEGTAAAVQDKPCRRVGDYSLEGLSIAWENRHSIRERLRAMNSLMVHYDTKLGVELVPSKGDVPKSIPNLRANDMVLTPVSASYEAERFFFSQILTGLLLRLERYTGATLFP